MQADLEFIEFDRANPSLSFVRILQQISSMKINSDVANAQQAQGLNPNQADENPTKDEQNFNYTEPQPSWGHIEYYIALYSAILDKDSDLERKIYDAYRTIIKDDLSKCLHWECQYLLIKQENINESAIEPIKKIIENNPTVIDLHSKLARAYLQYDSNELAYEEFNIALCSGQHWNVAFLQSTIDALVKSKGNQVAVEYLKNNSNKINNNNEDRFRYLTVYGGLFKDDLPNVYCSLIEAALAIKPEDSSSRFDLAYKYSEMGLNQQAAFHYKILCQNSPSETHWNNLGVSYDSLDIHTKSIEAYLKSEKLGGTLAMSNMAKRLLNAGFADQATDLCNKAMKFEKYDNRVISTLQSINEKKESEEKTVNLIAEETKVQREFSIHYANAFSTSTLKMLSGKYQHKDCVLDVNIIGNKFSATGSFEKTVPAAGLLGLAIEPDLTKERVSKINNKLTYVGDIYGDAIAGKVIRESDKTYTLLGSQENNKDALIYFSELENAFFVSERLDNGVQDKPYKLTKIS